MAPLNLQRISYADAGAEGRVAELRARVTATGELVSPRGRELTVKVFGEPLTPGQVVERICKDVRTRGVDAVLGYTEQLDGVRLRADQLRVCEQELADAHAHADKAFLEAIRRARHNVLTFQRGVLHADAVLRIAGSHEIRLRYHPLRRVGVCIPGGAASYPSTLVMTVCPAQAAGVREVAVVVPPGRHGAGNLDLLATCRELGVSEVYRVGGAQAVAALAYGVEGLPAVDMIAGPGNLFVTLAKKYVYGQVAIDLLAGPSEVVILADSSADPAHVAADLIAQAEHSPGMSILITWHEPLLERVASELERQLQPLSRGALARESLERFGALVLARDEGQGVAWVNAIAPEHVEVLARDAARLAEAIDNAGSIFLGPYTPVAVGDYIAGPSHVLPTGGTARFASGLSANDFLRRSSVVSFTREKLDHVAGDVRRLAEKEGLTAHAVSVDIRLSKEDAAEPLRPCAAGE
jgi:histidinol dehydrogenase